MCREKGRIDEKENWRRKTHVGDRPPGEKKRDMEESVADRAVRVSSNFDKKNIDGDSMAATTVPEEEAASGHDRKGEERLGVSFPFWDFTQGEKKLKKDRPCFISIFGLSKLI